MSKSAISPVAVNKINNNFVSASVDMSGTMEQKFQSIFTIISGRNYAVDKSYPVMLYISGTTFNGIFTGTFNMSSGGIRFLVADETRVIHGLFRRSDNTILNIEDLNSKLDYYTLLNGETVTSTNTNKTLFNSRKLSDYRLLLAIAKRSGACKVSTLVVRGLFSISSDVISLAEVDSTNIQRWYEIKYVNDTTVSIQCSSNVTGSASVYLYGLH